MLSLGMMFTYCTNNNVVLIIIFIFQKLVSESDHLQLPLTVIFKFFNTEGIFSNRMSDPSVYNYLVNKQIRNIGMPEYFQISHVLIQAAVLLKKIS